MALSEKYWKLTIPKINEEEPVFILRAQDKLAEAAIQMYKALAISHGSPVAGDIEKVIGVFQQWKGSRKIPD
jgi:hypothetical protein